MTAHRARLTEMDIQRLVKAADDDERAEAAHKLCRNMDRADLDDRDRQAAQKIVRLLANDAETQDKVRAAVKLGLTAFTLEWDGHVQAMIGKREFWKGVADLNLRQPQVKFRA